MADRLIPSPDDVQAAQSERGGWSKDTLAGWGIPWPPKKGWRARLRREWEQQQAARKRLVSLGTHTEEGEITPEYDR